MKTDSQRQAEYQLRRSKENRRVTVWFNKSVLERVDEMRGSCSRTEWINRAVNELLDRNTPDHTAEVRYLDRRELKT